MPALHCRFLLVTSKNVKTKIVTRLVTSHVIMQSAIVCLRGLSSGGKKVTLGRCRKFCPQKAIMQTLKPPFGQK